MPMVLALGFGESPFPSATEPWCVPADLADCIPDPGSVDVASVCSTASALLRNFSGRRYGVRRLTVRPHREVGEILMSGISPTPTGTVLTPIGSVPRLGWGWGAGQGILLDGPANVLSVSLDGVDLDSSQWELMDGRLLIRAGSVEWPYDQDLSRPLGAENTFGITYESGVPVPAEAKMACQALACELLKLMVGSSDCAIPDRVSAITRQGVSMQRLDPSKFMDDGWTGVRLTDLWLASLRAARSKRRASIMGPESYRGARTS